ncbi:hypothetical protein ElyMa_006405900 [Elysia marginata]|uniref:Uncharacterized protein n=1 Tax=Elysia marginata TaxID=1093978 RepID=A0AAV4HRC0_9GAST|nr:hypothetical protein ElyMa_006405900 [Elysia marginata]
MSDTEGRPTVQPTEPTEFSRQESEVLKDFFNSLGARPKTNTKAELEAWLVSYVTYLQSKKDVKHTAGFAASLASTSVASTLPAATMVARTSATATSDTAAQPVPILHLGRKPWLMKFTGDPLDCQLWRQQLRSLDHTSYAAELRRRLQTAASTAGEAQQRQKDWYDSKSRGGTLQPGDRVLLKPNSETAVPNAVGDEGLGADMESLQQPGDGQREADQGEKPAQQVEAIEPKITTTTDSSEIGGSAEGENHNEGAEVRRSNRSRQAPTWMTSVSLAVATLGCLRRRHVATSSEREDEAAA